MKMDMLLVNLGFTENEVEQLMKSKLVVQEKYENLYYLRFLRGTSLFKRWTVIFNVNEIIPPYPPVRRIYNIKNGLTKHFGDKEFYMEELVDGYNVRIAYVFNKVVAITKDGIVCPFSTERIYDFFDVEKFFKENPSLILVGVIAGPDNPYVRSSPTYVKDDIQFFLVDIMKKISGELLPVEERMNLAEKYGIPKVRNFGKFSTGKLNDVLEFVQMVDEEGNKGVVFKDPESKQTALKYTTPSFEFQTISKNASYIMEIPSSNFVESVLRIAAYISEMKPDKKSINSLSTKLGKAFIEPVKGLFEAIENKKPIDETFKIRVKNPETAQRLIDLFYKRGLEVKINDIHVEEDQWIVEFSRPHPQTAAKISGLWRGSSVVD
ncbi:MAG: RNA ligase [Candidatus Asgardarchaeia archaeon]